MSINNRISQIILLKASGSQKAFGERMGWSQQYVNKIASEGGSVGMDPVRKILEEFQDIDARWLVTGKGNAIDQNFISDITDSLYSNIRELLELERFIPYMDEVERAEYKSAASGLSKASFSADQIEKWHRLHQKDQLLKSQFENQ